MKALNEHPWWEGQRLNLWYTSTRKEGEKAHSNKGVGVLTSPSLKC